MNARIFLTCFFFISICHSIDAGTVSRQKTAVLIIGKDATANAEYLLDRLANLFIKNNILPQKFYYPNARWASIKKAAITTDFFIYCGHGFSNGGLTGDYGGMYLNEFVTAEMIVSELEFQYKPLIICQHSCGAAGSSAGDPDDIGLQLAGKRITDTAIPYFMAGAGGYFASNWHNGSHSFLTDFLAGKSLSDTFERIGSELEDILINAPITGISELKDLNLGIAGAGSGRKIYFNTVNGVKYKTVTESNPKERDYNTAYVGPKDFNVTKIDSKLVGK